MYHKYTQEQINQPFMNIGTIGITWGGGAKAPLIYLIPKNSFFGY